MYIYIYIFKLLYLGQISSYPNTQYINESLFIVYISIKFDPYDWFCGCGV